MESRKKGARALAAGLLCWGVNLFLMRTVGYYGPVLVILGALGIFAGAVLLVWGDSFRTMPLVQKVPAALISLAVVSGLALVLLRLGPSLMHR
jgi:hypothetical protein